MTSTPMTMKFNRKVYVIPQEKYDGLMAMTMERNRKIAKDELKDEPRGLRASRPPFACRTRY